MDIRRKPHVLCKLLSISPSAMNYSKNEVYIVILYLATDVQKDDGKLSFWHVSLWRAVKPIRSARKDVAGESWHAGMHWHLRFVLWWKGIRTRRHSTRKLNLEILGGRRGYVLFVFSSWDKKNEASSRDDDLYTAYLSVGMPVERQTIPRLTGLAIRGP